MAALPYFGTYGRFTATEKGDGARLFSADSLIGDEITCSLEMESGRAVGTLSNRFGGKIGVLDRPTSEAVQLCRAKGWDVHLLLASVYQEQGGSGSQWGEVVMCAYPKSSADALDSFVSGVGNLLAGGTRPDVDLQQASLDRVVESGGSWMPTGRIPAARAEGSVLVKARRSPNDTMIELARAKNPGCMVAGWAFIAGVVALAIYLAKTLLGF